VESANADDSEIVRKHTKIAHYQLDELPSKLRWGNHKTFLFIKNKTIKIKMGANMGHPAVSRKA